MVRVSVEDRKVVIPTVIFDLAMEAKSPYNDGWTQQVARDRLIATRDYINKILGNKG